MRRESTPPLQRDPRVRAVAAALASLLLLSSCATPAAAQEINAVRATATQGSENAPISDAQRREAARLAAAKVLAYAEIVGPSGITYNGTSIFMDVSLATPAAPEKPDGTGKDRDISTVRVSTVKVASLNYTRIFPVNDFRCVDSGGKLVGARVGDYTTPPTPTAAEVCSQLPQAGFAYVTIVTAAMPALDSLVGLREWIANSPDAMVQDAKTYKVDYPDPNTWSCTDTTVNSPNGLANALSMIDPGY